MGGGVRVKRGRSTPSGRGWRMEGGAPEGVVVLVVHRCRWPCCWASCGRRWRGPCHQMEAVPVGRARGGPCRAVHRSRRGAVAMEGGARVRRGLGVGEARALRISASVLEGCLESWLWSVPRGLGVCLASSSSHTKQTRRRRRAREDHGGRGPGRRSKCEAKAAAQCWQLGERLRVHAVAGWRRRQVAASHTSCNLPRSPLNVNMCLAWRHIAHARDGAPSRGTAKGAPHSAEHSRKADNRQRSRGRSREQMRICWRRGLCAQTTGWLGGRPSLVAVVGSGRIRRVIMPRMSIRLGLSPPQTGERAEKQQAATARRGTPNTERRARHEHRATSDDAAEARQQQRAPSAAATASGEQRAPQRRGSTEEKSSANARAGKLR